MNQIPGWTVDELRRNLASPRADVGGGTAVLLGASLGAALMAMAGTVTLQSEEPPGLAAFRDTLAGHSERLLALAEEDGLAYGRVVEARRLPRETDDQRRVRDECVARALDAAIRTPLEAATVGREVLVIGERLVGLCRRNTHTDLASGALLVSVGIRGSLHNVRQNAAAVKEPQRRAEYLDQAEDIRGATDEILERILEAVEEML